MILVKFEHYGGGKRSLEKELPREMVPVTNEYILLEGNRCRVVRVTKGFNQQKFFILAEVMGASE